MPAVASAAGHDTLPLATENRSFSIPFYEYQLLRNQAKADEKERATQKLHARRIAINKELGQFSVQATHAHLNQYCFSSRCSLSSLSLWKKMGP